MDWLKIVLVTGRIGATSTIAYQLDDQLVAIAPNSFSARSCNAAHRARAFPEAAHMRESRIRDELLRGSVHLFDGTHLLIVLLVERCLGRRCNRGRKKKCLPAPS